MSKLIDISDKLNYEEKPKIKVKDIEVSANNDAITVLKVVSIIEDGDKMNLSDILKIYDMLFDEENQKKIDSLKLDMKDFTTFIMETVKILSNNNQENEGEAETPATT